MTLKALTLLTCEDIVEVINEMWNNRFTAFNSVCIEQADDFVILGIEQFLNHTWIPNPIPMDNDADSVSVATTIPNRHCVRINCKIGSTVGNAFDKMALHFIAKTCGQLGMNDDKLR